MFTRLIYKGSGDWNRKMILVHKCVRTHACFYIRNVFSIFFSFFKYVKQFDANDEMLI